MQRLARLTLVFAVLFAVFLIGPTLLSGAFGLYPLMKHGDLFDHLTPIVLIPFYWLLFEVRRDDKPSRNETIAFLLFAAFWAEGQGIHLAGNAIGHLSRAHPGSEVNTLANLYDEVIGHFLWHAGMVGLSALLIYRQWQTPLPKGPSGLGLAVTAGIVHGFTYFIVIVEAGTARLGVPFGAAVVLFASIRGRGKLREQPILAFFFVAYLVATLLFLGWRLYWGGLPEFSEVGIID